MKVKLLSLFMMLLFVAGCSNEGNTKTDATATSESAEQLAQQPQSIIGGLKISIDKQEINQKKTEDGERVLHTFTITGENMGSVPTGLGSIDFLLETDTGDQIELDHTMAMFGDEIAVGETLTGNVSFELEEGQEARKLIYHTGEEQLAEWEVNSK
ncbi:hypothetical protein B835_2902 [Enterococcus mundtii 3F]|uniref:DUF4352 domain-containing protein n=1 Tax=Enterococcus mundtii TaxID=53346 RepID=UPI00230494DA|nr:DUF4352 domain-containing protein [Enterococcus mundtii]MDA9462939.1 hypothetical protein [Enterococcus mundtii 3F]